MLHALFFPKSEDGKFELQTIRVFTHPQLSFLALSLSCFSVFLPFSHAHICIRTRVSLRYESIYTPIRPGVSPLYLFAPTQDGRVFVWRLLDGKLLAVFSENMNQEIIMVLPHPTLPLLFISGHGFFSFVALSFAPPLQSSLFRPT